MKYTDLFDYDPRAGTLVWKARPRHHFKTDRAWKRTNTVYAGKIAGSVNAGGYVEIRLNGKTLQAHRVIYQMVKGPIPKGRQVDHRDMDTCNNRDGNLRIATHSENKCNGGPYRNNACGIRGVSWCNRDLVWMSRICIDNRTIRLGTFLTKGLAAVARAKAELRYHGQFSRIQSALIESR